MNTHFERLQPLCTRESCNIHGATPGISIDLPKDDENCDVYVIKLDKQTGEYRGKPACDQPEHIEC